MKTIFQHVIITLVIVYLGCSATPRAFTIPVGTLTGNQLKPLGRFEIKGSQLELISSAVHFGIEFEGSECTLITSTNPSQFGYLQYELDGVYLKRLKVEGSRAEVKITALSSGKHVLWIYKATEAHSGPIFIHEVLAGRVKPIDSPSQPLIEFIGNSITCGAAADPSEIPCGTGSYHDQHNAYMAYGPRTARALKANFILSSVSGIGIYRNWNSDGPTMPQVYENTDLRERSGRPWNFGTYSPAIVSIALGTNDFSNGDGKTPRLPFDSATYTKNYVFFVRKVKSKYPKANIVLLNSPMVSGTRNEIFVQCLQRVKQQTDAAFPNDKPISIFLFKAMKARGCGGHPSVEDHGLMAEELIPFFKQVMSDT